MVIVKAKVRLNFEPPNVFGKNFEILTKIKARVSLRKPF
nr:MAG TPA: hypothetical protein [Caudoviricetes sp.]